MKASSAADRKFSWVNALAVALAYFLAARLGLSLAFTADQVSAVWPPTGIALAALLLLGRQYWPAVTVGAFAANVSTGAPLLAAGFIAAGNTLEAWVGAMLLHRIDPTLRRTKDVLALVAFSAVLSTTLSATIGVVSLCLTGVESWDEFVTLWRIWWVGDATGSLLVAPLVLTWVAPDTTRTTRNFEAAALVGLLTVTTVGIFTGPVAAANVTDPPVYAVFPFIIWAAVRFGPRLTATTVTLASAIAVVSTVRGAGPFATGDLDQSLVLLQLFMAVVAVTGLILAAGIAERELAVKAVRVGDARLTAILDNTSACVFAKDLEGRYVVVNESLARLFGWPSPSFALGKTDAQIHPPAVADQYMAHDRQVIEAGEPLEFEEVAELPERRVYLVVKFPLRDPEGVTYGVCGIATDITDRKRAEEALSNESRRKDDYLAMLAHELRNPLASIGNAVELLQSAPQESQKTWATGVIERQVRHLARLLDDLFDVSRITRGLVVLQKQRLDVRRAVDHAVESTRPFVRERSHALEVALPPGPIWVEADAARLEQILTNLLTNAARYTGPGGQIRVRAGSDSGEAVIEVEDTGQGIRAGDLPGIFDLFSRGNSHGRSDGGLGLGLTVVKSLAELHGGSVTAWSDGPGRGSRFVVRLPLAGRTNGSASSSDTVGSVLIPEPSVVRQEPGTRILVVDDNMDAAEAMKRWLELEGHVVAVAHDGSEALDVAEGFAPRLVLLDLGLPVMNGYEVAEEMRRRKLCADAIVAAVSGYGQERDRERARDAGIVHYFVKPVDPRDLRPLIREASARPESVNS